MKKIVTLLLIVASQFNAIGSAIPTISITKAKIIMLDLNDWTKKTVDVSILDDRGGIIYSEVMDADKVNFKKYDLKELPIGTYTVNIANFQKEVEYEVYVSYNGISIKDAEDVTFKPYITYDGEFIDINILTLGKDAEINLYDNEGNKLFTESNKGMSRYGKRLEIAKLPKGSYTLFTTVGDKNYSEEIKK